MSYQKILKKIPSGKKPPRLLQKFINAKPPFRIQWDDLDGHAFKKSVLQTIVPFMRLYDGGVVALWYVNDDPAVVLIGGEGETQVLAKTFEEFVQGINAGRSGLSDMDNRDDKFTVPGIKAKAPAKAAALQKQFDAWLEEQSGEAKPLTDDEAQALLLRVLAIVKRMQKDGWMRADTGPLNFEIRTGPKGVDVRFVKHANRGITTPRIPLKYEFKPEVEALLRLCRANDRTEHQLTIYTKGSLYITPPIGQGKASDLTLQTPEAAARLKAYIADERRRMRRR